MTDPTDDSAREADGTQTDYSDVEVDGTQADIFGTETDNTPTEGSDPEANTESPPAAIIREAERLTRLARQTGNDEERALYRRKRDEILDEHGFTARIRESDDTLVCYPSEWMAEGTAQVDRIEAVDKAVEVSLSGPGDPDRFDEVAEHNRSIVADIKTTYGRTHAANARAFADFMENHYVKQVDRATVDELTEFRTDYFRRNVWPTDEQRQKLDASLALVFEIAGLSPPDGADFLERVDIAEKQ